MLFSSFQFIFLFFPLALAVASRLKGRPLLVWINASSLVFYALTGHAWFTIPMLVTTVLDYNLSHLMARQASQAKRRRILVLSLIANLGLLAYFKYAGFLSDTVLGIARFASGQEWLVGDSLAQVLYVVMPAGISFYTFQTVSYMVDVYRGEAEPEESFWRFSAFVSFFPHLVAGPLTRHHQLIPGLARIGREGISIRWREGVPLFVLGLSKKVLIADRIAHFIDPILAQPSELNFTTGWLALIGFSLQIYFDFSAYSDMAIGLGRLFGIELPQNFNNPYQAVSPRDFWTRWHTTLSKWLRDYLYIPLGGNRHGRRRQQLSLMVTMFLGGLWHGASWTFAVWGLYHGLLLAAYHMWRREWDSCPQALQRAATFSLVTIGWLFFRADNLHFVGVWLGALVGSNGFYAEQEKLWKLVVLIVIGLSIVRLGPVASSHRGWLSLSAFRQAALAVLFVVALLFIHESSKFIYFQF